MARYAIGDIHGCFGELTALLARLDFRPGRDELFLTGDLVNRGPGSLAALRWARANEGCVHTVLGNHDLHLVAASLGVGRGDASDTIAGILAAPDRAELIAWLTARPLLVRERDFVLVHAGLAPGWTIDEAEARAHRLERALRGGRLADIVRRDLPESLRGDAELLDLRRDLSLLTRLRACRADGAMDERYTGPLAGVPAGTRAWFDWPHPPRALPIVIGHWAALDVTLRPDLIALDSGCVWGRALTALDLDTRALIQQPALDRPTTTREERP